MLPARDSQITDPTVTRQIGFEQQRGNPVGPRALWWPTRPHWGKRCLSPVTDTGDRGMFGTKEFETTQLSPAARRTCARNAHRGRAHGTDGNTSRYTRSRPLRVIAAARHRRTRQRRPPPPPSCEGTKIDRSAMR